ncbi:hypothetical protein GCM10009798_32660 [Nocardioides panacihumi]|uniref:PBP domain-containing protein n=1 Tax=Nocardioides panacihumi TaxID=400774 RepID=A0ABN2RI87_9ACTN
MRTTPWFLRSRRLRRVAAAALVVDLGLGVLFTALAVSAGAAETSSATASAASTGSSVTVRWVEDRASFDPDYVDATTPDPQDRNQPLFTDLEVTVSQTKDLTDQGLQVSWKGGRPSVGSGAGADFLQLMQCWAGPGASGPTPEQCQWGTPSGAVAAQTGTATSTRLLFEGDEADPKQDLGADRTHAQFGRDPEKLVPFWSVDDPEKKDLGWVNDAYNQPPYNSAQSNEVTYARTAADGTGQYIVNLQSALSSPYLGCGNPTLTRAGYSCWLVVVPRGEFNLNGARADTHDDSLPQNSQYVAGSPLSASAWQDRIQVRLSFTAIGASCRLGDNEIATAGSELVAAAFSSWQSALCSQGTTLGYSQVGDGQARSALQAGGDGSPGLTFMTDPIDPATTGDADIEYAPVSTSGLVVSYLIDKNYTGDTDNPDRGANGTLVTDLRLTPLLVAKLLTQSYRGDTPGNGQTSQVSKDNPVSIRTDPEFLALNPDFAYFYKSSAPDGLVVPFGDTDAAQAVWAWLRSDTATRRFLSGQTVGGVTINPAYRDLGLESDETLASFPKADGATFLPASAPKTAPEFGTLDMRPYASSFTDGARRTVTASSGSKTTWDVTKVPAQYVSDGSQTPGTRFEMAITTSQAASLYGLPVASLVSDRTDTGPGVAPTADAMTKELARRVATAAPGVYRVDPMKDVEGGYPLTMQTYAAINVCAAGTTELTAYARLLDYVAGGGQNPGTKLGQLPLGYAPLGAADKAQARSVAADLRAEIAKPRCPSHQATADPSPTSGPTTTPPTPTPPPTQAQPPLSGPTAPAVVQAPVAAPTAAAPGAVVDARALGITPVAQVSPAARYAVLAALLFALPCLVAGPTIVRAGRRSR